MKKGTVILFYPSYEGIGVYHWVPFPYLYIAPFLEQAGFNVMILDARVEPKWREILSEHLPTALCLGITSMTGPDIKQALESAKMAKDLNKNIIVTWGGPQATVQPEMIIKLETVDIVVRGQGEHVFAEVVSRASENRDYSDIPGITYKKDGEIHGNPEGGLISFDYDIFPAYHLIDIERYRSENNVISMFSVRGCPYACTFCTTGTKTYSEKSLDKTKKEILYIVNDLKFKNIFFQDGTYFVKKPRVLELAKWFIEAGLNIKWKAKSRTNSLLSYTDEEMRILTESGLVSLFFGVESGAQKVLTNMIKATKSGDAEKSAELCDRHGIEFYASYMFATPYEDVTDLHETIGNIRRIRKIQPDALIQNCIYLPLPGTKMYNQAIECGFEPPSTLEKWGERNISSLFDQRTDVTWIPKDILRDYAQVYNEEFGDYKHAWEREKEGTLKSVFVDE